MNAYLDQLPEKVRTSFLDLGDHDACLEWINGIARSLGLVNLDYEDHGIMIPSPVYELSNAIEYAAYIKAEACSECGCSGRDHKPAGSPELRYDT